MNPSQHLLDELRSHTPAGVTAAQLEDWLARHPERISALLGQRGRIYQIAGNWYIDTLALQRITEAHEVMPVQADAWHVLLPGGILHARPVDGLPPLPGQRGQVFRVRPRGELAFPAALHQLCAQDLTVHVGTWNAWPSVASQGCGCGPCQGKTESPTPSKGCGCGPGPKATESTRPARRPGTVMASARALARGQTPLSVMASIPGPTAPRTKESAATEEVDLLAEQVHLTLRQMLYLEDVARYGDRAQNGPETFPEQDDLRQKLVAATHKDPSIPMQNRQWIWTRDSANRCDDIEEKLEYGFDEDEEDLESLLSELETRAKEDGLTHYMALAAEFRRLNPALCERCNTPLEDLGCHGIGCPRCADDEMKAMEEEFYP